MWNNWTPKSIHISQVNMYWHWERPKNAKKTISPRIFNFFFFLIFIGHGWTNRIWHTSGKLCVKYTNVSTSDKKIRPVYCNTLTNIYMGLQMKDKKNLIPLRGRQPHARAPQSFNCKIWSIIGEVWFSKLAFCSPSKSTNPFQKWLLYLKCLVTSRNNLGK